MTRKLLTALSVVVVLSFAGCRPGAALKGGIDVAATGTAIAGQVVAQLTATAAAVPTATPVPAPTNTPVPPPTDTPVPTPTNTLVVPPTDTPVPAPTDTPAPAPTDTPVPPPTNTPAPAPTDTPVPPPTNTPAPAPTNTPEPGGTSLPWTEAVGEPSFAPGQNLGYFLWIDSGGTVHLRCVTHGAGRLFTDVIKGDAPIRNLNRIRQEGMDVTLREDLNQIDFSWTTAGGPDGLNFDFKGNRLVFHLRIDGQPAVGLVYVGASNRQISDLPLTLYR